MAAGNIWIHLIRKNPFYWNAIERGISLDTSCFKTSQIFCIVNTVLFLRY